MTQTITEQENLAAESTDEGFVCMLATKGADWTWYVDKVAHSAKDAEVWFDVQRSIARVYQVKKQQCLQVDTDLAGHPVFSRSRIYFAK